MEGLGEAFKNIGESIIKVSKNSGNLPDKPIPSSYLFPQNVSSVNYTVYILEEIDLKKKFPIHFPPKQEESSSAHLLVIQSHILPAKEPVPWNMTRVPAPNLYGKGNLPKAQTFTDENFPEWNIDSMTTGQIRQVIDIMCVFYRVMCMKGKSEIEACKSIIQCFTGTLAKWWEIESSPALVEKMENEQVKDENGDIVFKDGQAENNMIGALTTFILEHWCGTKQELSDKHAIILMGMRCKRMSNYDDFHREWTQRIYEVKDSKTLLWKQVYLAALPNKFVEYLKVQKFLFSLMSFILGEKFTQSLPLP